MRTSENTEVIAAALLEFQKNSVRVTKNKGVKVEGENKTTGAAYGYKSGFATLDSIISAIRVNLATHGISFIQGGHFSEKAGWTVVTRISAGDQWYEVEYPVKANRDGAQAFGGGRSFAKRYGITDILGLEIEDDFDEGQGYKEAKLDARPAKRAAAPAGIATALAAIRGAKERESLLKAVQSAKAAYPTGDAAAAVLREVTEWFLGALERATTLDQLTILRDLATELRPSGNAVREAIRVAGARLEGGAP